jgi:hypothetical protein|tara:strand:- start:1803 stop:2126 length:324 start_codon:yes stop_codon:yes gene_type:complete
MSTKKLFAIRNIKTNEYLTSYQTYKSTWSTEGRVNRAFKHNNCTDKNWAIVELAPSRVIPRKISTRDLANEAKAIAISIDKAITDGGMDAVLLGRIGDLIDTVANAK